LTSAESKAIAGKLPTVGLTFLYVFRDRQEQVQ